MFDLTQLGPRLQRLRAARGFSQYHLNGMGFPHSMLSKVENGRVRPGVEYLEPLCDVFGIGLNRLFSDGEQFDGMLALEDQFTLQVRPFLKQLNDEQRKYILKVLEAAPKQIVNHGGRKSAATANRTSSASGNCTASRDLNTLSRTSAIRSSQSALSPTTKVEYRRQPHF